MELIRFVRNYKDQSTDRGFQFEFYCDRCRVGYRTPFKTSATGLVSEALDAAGDLFGGILGSAASVGERVHSAAWEKAHDKAFAEAVEQARPHFRQCPHCSKWVCVDKCWNETRGLCKGCAPDLAVEMSAMQASAAMDKARQVAHEAASERVTPEAFDDVIKAVCPQCGAPVGGGKFCAQCGAPLAAEKFCAQCGAKIPADAKFCPECGVAQT